MYHLRKSVFDTHVFVVFSYLGGGWFMVGGESTLSSYYFASNTGYEWSKDMHRASGVLSLRAECPSGTHNYGRGVLRCESCSTEYVPQVLYDADCRPWTALENASSQLDLERAVMFNRSVVLRSDVQLTSGVALLTTWRDRKPLPRGLVFDGQVS